MKNFVRAMMVMSVLGLAAGAHANDESSTGSSSGQGGSGSSGSMGGTGSTGSGSMGSGSQGSTGSQQGTLGGTQTGLQSQSMEGKVLKADRNSITIEHMGAAIPLQVQSSTSFQGVKSARDIKEGQQVRASFNLNSKGAKNELTSVEVIGGAGQGGTGYQGGSKSGSDSFGGSGSGSSGSQQDTGSDSGKY